MALVSHSRDLPASHPASSTLESAAQHAALKTASPLKMSSPSTPAWSAEEDDAKSSRSNHIVGPNGERHTQGEAARLGLIIRTACESCRNRKLKCSGTLPQDGGCERCSADSIPCLYSARAPIGRPKKRKSEGESDGTPKTSRRKSKPSQSPLAPIHKGSDTPESSSSAKHRPDLPENAAVSGCSASLPETPLPWDYRQPSDNLFSFAPANGSAMDTKLPSLDDLSIAAFLQSLDTLEISPEELRRQQQHTADRQLPAVNGSSFPTYPSLDPVATSLQDWASSSAILQPGLSFAVPADFSWWDLGLGADPADSGNPSTAATPAFERPQPFMPQATMFSDRSLINAVVPSQPERSPPSPSRKQLSSQNWPRGATAGMGQGQIQQTHAASEGGLGWSTFALPTERTPSVSGLSDSSALDGCCSTQIKAEPEMPACCSGKAKKPDAKPSAPPAVKSCCSGKEESSAAVDKKVPHEHPSKVHCVPNPSGKGCTCLCDMSVALLSVKQVLRETDPSKQPQTQAKQDMGALFASNTIQLTLTASQAITAQCACSTDCPTCQSDPSTEISASLLVSTALQIYARAVRILREGFASSAGHASGGYSSSSAANAFFGGLEVTIGSYKPSSSNAKKIALFAIKLELKDLRKALGKVSRMAQDFNTGEDGVLEDKFKSMNPIDQLVIYKLYRQLTELLKTVEGLEDAA